MDLRRRYRTLLCYYTLAALVSFCGSSLAATDVWVFYGAGPVAFSSGMNQVARKARVISGVGVVHGPYRYYETQRAYDEALAAPPGDKKVFVGYSCGGNASLAVAQGLARNAIPAYVLGMQPSLWCGWYLPTTSNVVYSQSTYGGCLETLGLGCMRFYGDAQATVNIFRPENHLRADTDPDYQRDVLYAISCIANDRRCRDAKGFLARSGTITLRPGQ